MAQEKEFRVLESTLNPNPVTLSPEPHTHNLELLTLSPNTLHP